MEERRIDPDWSLIDQIRGQLQLAGIDIAYKLDEHGYEMNEKGDYRHPASESGSFGLKIYEGDDGVERAYSLNAGDPLHEDNLAMAGLTSKSADVLDVIAMLEYDGKQNAALSALAAQYSIGRNSAADDGLRPLPDEPRAKTEQDSGQQQKQKQAGQQKKPKRFDLTPWQWVAASGIDPREWVYGSHYIRRYLTATFAPGATGKSSLASVEALDMVTRKSLLPDNELEDPAPLRVWYHNGEDPIDEINRRVAAICKHYGITAEDIGDRLIVTSGRTNDIIVAKEDRNGLIIQHPDVNALRAAMKEYAVDVLILDPFVFVHEVSENDNVKIGAVAKLFARIAEEANASVELIHHTRKSSAGAGGDRSVDDGRGGGAVAAATRSVRVINRMSGDDAMKLCVSDAERLSYFRVDGGEKANLTPPGKAVWRRMASVWMDNARNGRKTDFVGVAERWVIPTPKEAAEAALSDDKIAELQSGATRREVVPSIRPL